tara:strand:+ start:7770 stop:8747 length:978 start_codon:yes stop_codon:yes gene_type:complete
MATSNIQYCTHRDIKDTYPAINDSGDAKRPIYGWVTTGTSNLYLARDTGLVTQLFADGEDLGDAEANSGVVDTNGEWYYDSNLDTVYYFNSSTNPIDMLMESGDDYATLITRVAKRASRMIDSKIGYRVTDTQIKDREGNYPDIIVRAASLQSVILLLTSEDPTNPIIEPFKEELLEIVEGINAGTIVILGNQRTMDAAQGIIREVSVNASSDLRPVELTGHYTGSAYELLKVYIDSGENGVIGTTRMTVKGKDSTKLKNTVLIDSEIITGDYQSLGLSGMKIRWSGDNDAAVTTADDEYEIEVFGHNLDSSTPGQVGNIKMTRR